MNSESLSRVICCADNTLSVILMSKIRFLVLFGCVIGCILRIMCDIRKSGIKKIEIEKEGKDKMKNRMYTYLINCIKR